MLAHTKLPLWINQDFRVDLGMGVERLVDTAENSRSPLFQCILGVGSETLLSQSCNSGGTDTNRTLVP